MISTIRLQREAFDAAAETAGMTRGRTDIGAAEQQKLMRQHFERAVELSKGKRADMPLT